MSSPLPSLLSPAAAAAALPAVSCRDCMGLVWAGVWYWKRLAWANRRGAMAEIPRLLEKGTSARREWRNTWTGDHTACQGPIWRPTQDLDQIHYCRPWRPFVDRGE